MKEEFDKLGIIFTDTDSALKEYPELFKKYFAKLVPPTDNKLAALNSAVWSGGTFIYMVVLRGHVEMLNSWHSTSVEC